MIDTLAISQDLMDAGLEQESAEAIARAIRNGQVEAASKDFVRGENGVIRAEMGELRAEMGELRGKMGELQGQMGDLRAEMMRQHNVLLRWIMTLGFGAIAGVIAQLLFLILQQ